MKAKELLNQLKKYKGRFIKIENDLIILDRNYDSYRGDYTHLALGYEANTYKPYPNKINKVEEFINFIENLENELMIGWKGGEYKVNFELPIMIANSGIATEMYISEIENDDYYTNLKLSKIQR